MSHLYFNIVPFFFLPGLFNWWGRLFNSLKPFKNIDGNTQVNMVLYWYKSHDYGLPDFMYMYLVFRYNDEKSIIFFWPIMLNN